MIIPTKRFWGLVLGGLLLAALGAVIPGAERLLIPYDVGLLVLLFGSSKLMPPISRFRIERRFDPVLSVRVPNLVRLNVELDGSGAVNGILRDEPPPGFECDERERPISLTAGRPLELSYHVTPKERGADYFRGTYARLRAPLGLADVQYRFLTEQPLRVYPNVQALKEFDLLKQRGRLNLMGIRRARIKGLGTEFESLRDYNDDDYRRVDWKSTARQGKLVVREYEQERNQAVLVFLDVSRHMLSEVDGVRKLDHCLDASLMLMHTAAASGDQVGLIVFGETVQRYIPPKKGRHQTSLLLDAIHSLDAEPTEANFRSAFGYLQSRWKRRSLIVVFTDVENEEEAAELSLALSPLLRRHLVMVVRVADPRLKELEAIEFETAEQMFKKAGVLWYLSERKRAEIVLLTAGVQNISSEPQDLATALVSAYLKVKATSAL